MWEVKVLLHVCLWYKTTLAYHIPFGFISFSNLQPVFSLSYHQFRTSSFHFPYCCWESVVGPKAVIEEPGLCHTYSVGPSYSHAPENLIGLELALDLAPPRGLRRTHTVLAGQGGRPPQAVLGIWDAAQVTVGLSFLFDSI